MYLQKINLKKKYALVTGAGKGLGRACSIALAEAGATIIALSRTQSDLNKLEKDIKKIKGKIIKIECDVMDYQDLKEKLNTIIFIVLGLIICTSFINSFNLRNSVIPDLENSYIWLNLFNWIPALLGFIGFQSYVKTKEDRLLFS